MLNIEERCAAALSELQDFIELRTQHHTREMREEWAHRSVPEVDALSPSKFARVFRDLRNAAQRVIDRETLRALAPTQGSLIYELTGLTPETYGGAWTNQPHDALAQQAAMNSSIAAQTAASQSAHYNNGLQEYPRHWAGLGAARRCYEVPR